MAVNVYVVTMLLPCPNPPNVCNTIHSGSEIYQETLVKALAKHFGARLLVVDSLLLPGVSSSFVIINSDQKYVAHYFHVTEITK